MPFSVINPISKIKTPIREINRLLPDFQILKRKSLFSHRRRCGMCHILPLPAYLRPVLHEPLAMSQDRSAMSYQPHPMSHEL